MSTFSETETETESEQGYAQLLWQPRYLRYFISQVLVSLGDGFFAVLVTFMALAKGASPGSLGLVAFSLTFPRGILGLLGGAVADRFDRKRLMMQCDTARTCGIALIAMLAYADALSILMLTLLGAIVNVTYAVSKPASKAFVPRVVRRDELALANGLVQSIQWPAFFVGSGVVGVAYLYISSPGALFSACALLYAVSGLSLWGIRMFDSVPALSSFSEFSILKDLKLGLDELRAHRELLVRVMSYLLYTMVWRGVIVIALPIYVIDALDQPATYYSYLMVACGAGELVSSLAIGRVGCAQSLKLAFAGEFILASALLLLGSHLFGHTLPVHFSLLAVTLIGLSATVIDIPLITAVQTKVTDGNAGKVFSFWSALGALGGSIGTLLVSALIQQFGVKPALTVLAGWLALSGALMVLLAYRGDQLEANSDA